MYRQFIVYHLLALLALARRPIVLWHGMGDTCCDGLGDLKAALEEWYPSTYVYSVQIGTTPEEDRQASFFGKIEDQVDMVCDQFKRTKELKDGFDAFGFSQGGLFLRAYVQQCNGPPVKTLITFGSPHGGVSDIPNCEHSDDIQCKTMRKVVSQGVYWSWIQSKIVQAQYYKDYLRLGVYLSNNIFLPDLNNERAEKNQVYKKRLAKLEKLVLIKFEKDKMIVPGETAWFSFYNEHGKLVELRNQDLYKNDYIGLKQLDERNSLVFESLEGNHMHFTIEEFKDIAERHLGHEFKPLRIQ